MADFEIIGEEQKLSKKPTNVSTFGRSTGQFEGIEDAVKLSTKPAAPPYFSSGRGGEFQVEGGVDLNHAPSQPWGEHGAPFADPTEALRAGKGRKGR